MDCALEVSFSLSGPAYQGFFPMELWGAGSFYLPASCLSVWCQFLSSWHRVRRSFRLARCALNWVLCVPRESVLLCAPVRDLLCHNPVSKSEKADLQVFITCAGCQPSRVGSRMSEHRGREVSKQKGPAQHLDLYTLMAVKR